MRTTMTSRSVLKCRTTHWHEVTQISRLARLLRGGVTAAVDTSKDPPLLITCQLAVSTDTCQLERFSVEILKPN
ncbi:hypothetical protein BCF11_4865 [Collimonas sp. PA-H2]|nr:hypothetical protein BCF11_4865 [Collimonas sp. PA-H2]